MVLSSTNNQTKSDRLKGPAPFGNSIPCLFCLLVAVGISQLIPTLLQSSRLLLYSKDLLYSVSPVIL